MLFPLFFMIYCLSWWTWRWQLCVCVGGWVWVCIQYSTNGTYKLTNLLPSDTWIWIQYQFWQYNDCTFANKFNFIFHLRPEVISLNPAFIQFLLICILMTDLHPDAPSPATRLPKPKIHPNVTPPPPPRTSSGWALIGRAPWRRSARRASGSSITWPRWRSGRWSTPSTSPWRLWPPSVRRRGVFGHLFNELGFPVYCVSSYSLRFL